jgi:hypothetical protein
MECAILFSPTEEIEPSCRQIAIDNHRWCNANSSHHKAQPCMFGDMMEQIPTGSFDEAGTFTQKYEQLKDTCLELRQKRHTHGEECIVSGPEATADVDMSGLPCTGSSKINTSLASNEKYEEHKTNVIFMTWAKKHIFNGTPLLILENVTALRLQMMLLFPHRWFCSVFC